MIACERWTFEYGFRDDGCWISNYPYLRDHFVVAEFYHKPPSNFVSSHPIYFWAKLPISWAPHWSPSKIRVRFCQSPRCSPQRWFSPLFPNIPSSVRGSSQTALSGWPQSPRQWDWPYSVCTPQREARASAWLVWEFPITIPSSQGLSFSLRPWGFSWVPWPGNRLRTV